MSIPLLAAIGTAVLVVTLVWAFLRPRWMGFAGITLWDWIKVLSVSLMVGFATFLISTAQAETERDRAREAALQQFFDRISNLLLDERAQAAPEVSYAVGRAHSQAILRLVEGERAGRALGFLADLDLLQKFEIEFENLKLAAAELKDLDLQGLDFEGSNLAGAEMERANLSQVDFEDADLTGADLKGAILSGASFEGTQMAHADLDHADFRGVDLSRALGLTQAQLDRACLNATTRVPAGFNIVRGETSGCSGEADD